VAALEIDVGVTNFFLFVCHGATDAINSDYLGNSTPAAAPAAVVVVVAAAAATSCLCILDSQRVSFSWSGVGLFY
jgi:hypothetical protein